MRSLTPACRSPAEAFRGATTWSFDAQLVPRDTLRSYSAGSAPERTFLVEQQRPPAQAVHRVVQQPAPHGADVSVFYMHAHTSMTSPQTGPRGIRAPEVAGQRQAGVAAADPFPPALAKIVGETLALQEKPRAHQRREGRVSAAIRQPSQAVDKNTEIELMLNMDGNKIVGQQEAFKRKVAISVAVAVKGIVSKVLPLHVEPGSSIPLLYLLPVDKQLAAGVNFFEDSKQARIVRLKLARVQ